ncbi:hypothetical protein SIID45300_00436 [Candidatus Magnetaquicoccaceae bacterium FCR-1]|uniref:Bacteriophage-related protein n=1 Tax=Candidatus Magnetaquiglobus chichijimensis TaxID=3141448 RepID=A0ABQ0C5G4_9PROT
MKTEMRQNGEIIVVTIPLQLKRRGGRKLIIAPEGAVEAPPREETLGKLVAKAHRWLRMMESGQYRSIKDLAAQEQIDDSYLARVLRLTLLAPDIIVAILDGRQPDVLTWRELKNPFPMEWEQQREKWGFCQPTARPS